jgi:hypothetical protein
MATSYPTFTLGPPVVNPLENQKMTFDILMIPSDRYAPILSRPARTGSRSIRDRVHLGPHPPDDSGRARAGVVINPATPVGMLDGCSMSPIMFWL